MIASEHFQKNLAFGQIAETRIAKWLRSRGNHLLPAYDIEYETGKGPRLFGPLQKLVAPDFFVFGSQQLFWAECKRKRVFTWHRKTQRWTTGIDLYHWRDYLQVAEVTRTPVWLLFLHENSSPDARDLRFGCPGECPVGLYGNDIACLRDHISRTCDAFSDGTGWGKSGMVYWAVDDLRLLASLAEVTQPGEVVAQ